MSTWFVIVSAVAAINPARVADRLSATPEPVRRIAVAWGAAITLVVTLLLAWGASAILDALSLSNETWRIATGAVAVLAGGRYMLFGAGSPVPELDRPAHRWVPVAFPVLLVPEIVLLAVLFGATESFGLTAAALGAALVLAPVWPGEGDGPVNRAWVRMFAAVLVVVGIGLIVAGIRDV